MIEVKNLSKKFDNTPVLDKVSFEVNKGDAIVVIGPSGSGKTTLLRCMNFLTEADSGELIFDGEHFDLGNINKKEIARIRKKTAFVFQNFNLFANKTVLENVTEGLIVARKVDKKSAELKARQMLEKVGMEDKADRYPSQISGGQQQRVAIARALALDPEIIYFDEPTSALDPELLGEVLEVIKQLAKDGMTMIIVTHEMNFAKNVASKILFIDNGQMLIFDDPKSFFDDPKEKRIQDFLKNFINF